MLVESDAPPPEAFAKPDLASAPTPCSRPRTKLIQELLRHHRQRGRVLLRRLRLRTRRSGGASSRRLGVEVEWKIHLLRWNNLFQHQVDLPGLRNGS